MVQAAVAIGVPVIPSFTVETDGRLREARRSARRCSASTRDGRGGEFFMLNCAHPTHIAAGSTGLRRSGASAACG